MSVRLVTVRISKLGAYRSATSKPESRCEETALSTEASGRSSTASGRRAGGENSAPASHSRISRPIGGPLQGRRASAFLACSGRTRRRREAPDRASRALAAASECRAARPPQAGCGRPLPASGGRWRATAGSRVPTAMPALLRRRTAVAARSATALLPARPAPRTGHRPFRVPGSASPRRAGAERDVRGHPARTGEVGCLLTRSVRQDLAGTNRPQAPRLSRRPGPVGRAAGPSWPQWPARIHPPRPPRGREDVSCPAGGPVDLREAGNCLFQQKALIRGKRIHGRQGQQAGRP